MTASAVFFNWLTVARYVFVADFEALPCQVKRKFIICRNTKTFTTSVIKYMDCYRLVACIPVFKNYLPIAHPITFIIPSINPIFFSVTYILHTVGSWYRLVTELQSMSELEVRSSRLITNLLLQLQKYLMLIISMY